MIITEISWKWRKNRSLSRYKGGPFNEPETGAFIETTSLWIARTKNNDQTKLFFFFFKYIFTSWCIEQSPSWHFAISSIRSNQAPIVLESIERPSRIANAAFLRVSRVYMPHFQYGPCFFLSLFSKTNLSK